MNKRIINRISLVMLFMIWISIAVDGADDEKVFLVGLNYDNGKISMNKMLVKTGYSPDRKLQPIEGFKGEVVSFDDKVLDSFMFDVPLKVNTDVIDKGKVVGNVMILNETDFALLVPYHEEAKEINIYDEKDEIVFSAKVVKPSTGEGRRWLLAVVIGLMVGGISIVVYFSLRKRNGT
tara:strand:- start:34 stop:567 length:534 start_codon:yes stop_codon:yes gene_type:complete